jgi:AraC-like DNA-binding protein
LSVGELLGCVSGIDLPAVSYPVQLQGHAVESVESAMMRLLGQLTRQDPLARFAEQCLLAELLRVVVDEVYGPLLEPGEAPKPAPMVLVRELLTHRYWEPWTLDDLARSAGLSRAYLCRRFHREFGLPPMAYLHQVRVGAAKRLLQGTQLTVTEVALRVGYVDIYTFCKSFKRRTGQTPTEVRAGHAG